MLHTTWALSLAVALQAASPAPSRPAAPAVIQAPASAPVQAPADQWPDDRPLTRLLPNLWHDLTALPSPASGWILAMGGGAALGAHQADDRVADWAARSGDSSYTAIGRVLGNGWTQAGAAVAVYAVGKASHSPQAVHVGGDLIRAQTMNGVLTTVIKVAVDRDRPNGGRYSFPSGHTSATFSSAAVLQRHYGWKVGAPAYAIASFVGWNRVRDRAHWLSDVVFGAAVGTLAGYAVTAGHHDRRWVVAPAPVKGGMGILVSRVR